VRYTPERQRLDVTLGTYLAYHGFYADRSSPRIKNV
jgi:hypothetical protein